MKLLIFNAKIQAKQNVLSVFLNFIKKGLTRQVKSVKMYKVVKVIGFTRMAVKL